MPNHINISQLTLDQLISLNHDVVALIKSRRRREAQDMKSCLSVGDSVTVNADRIMHGTVKRIMRTRAIVTVNGRDWKVPMSMLTFQE